jgi:glycosyltransferase involved in cell wall biosynthesis
MHAGNGSIKIFINASTVLISGGLILALEIIESLQTNPNFDLIIICPKLKPYKKIQKENSRIVIAPRWMLLRYWRWYLDYIWLPDRIKRESPDLVFTLCNLPSVTRNRQIFLHDNPYVAEKNIGNIPLSLKNKIIHRVRNKLTLSRMKYVDLLLVQTPYQKSILEKSIKRKIPVGIMPPCLSQIKDPIKEVHIMDLLKIKNQYQVLCPTRYYEHKNLEILVKVSDLIKERLLPIKIYITISPKQGRRARNLLRTIKKNDIESILINLGHIDHRYLSGIMSNVDAVLLPSLLESFSLTCIEAWEHEKPLLVSDLETFKSACGNAAYYFNPLIPEEILKCIIISMADKIKRNEKLKNGIKRMEENCRKAMYPQLIYDFLEKSCEN